jgi:hypothetical protein
LTAQTPEESAAAAAKAVAEATAEAVNSAAKAAADAVANAAKSAADAIPGSLPKDVPSDAVDPVAVSYGLYRSNTTQLSILTRQLALAAIAIVWIFSVKTKAGTVRVPHDLTRVAFVAVAAMACDVLQYAWASFAWSRTYHKAEDGTLKKRTDPKKPFSDWNNWPSSFFFVVKVLALMVTYALLGAAIWKRLS